jgi:hypothetical protein
MTKVPVLFIGWGLLTGNYINGLIITLSFYLILQTINPDLVKFPLFSNLDINGVKSAGGGSPSATVK